MENSMVNEYRLSVIFLSVMGRRIHLEEMNTNVGRWRFGYSVVNYPDVWPQTTEALIYCSMRRSLPYVRLHKEPIPRGFTIKSEGA
jgi:hypothetical protein